MTSKLVPLLKTIDTIEAAIDTTSDSYGCRYLHVLSDGFADAS